MQNGGGSRDARKADGAIVLDGKVRAVIELKGCNTTDLAKIEPQAFGYKARNPGCRYVIISNFEKLRFYVDDASDFLEFNLFKLSRDEFSLLYLCLAFPQIAADVPAKLKQESLSREISVTDKLYADYSAFKRALFADIVARNAEKFDKLLLFRKTQKLLDRLLFVFFCEDRGLLPANALITEINKWTQLKALDAYVPLYERIKKFFRYIDSGYANDDKTYVIYAYNGGLFKADDVLDSISVSDEILLTHTARLAEYDFESEVGVDILGHIFEHSLSEIEEIQNEISGNAPAPAVGKRKKDGVFYTPAYITKYIVENTVGKLCDEKKNALGISDEIFAEKHNKHQKAELAEKLKAYRAWLLDLKICDPACGSGAFLNAALQFLKREHALVDELTAKLFGESLVFQEVDNAILENNLYGVDINEESVEIAKLSLWLHTAQKGRKLSSLNDNIKCGNSLISDPAVAGEKAFDWEKQFPQVFQGRSDILVASFKNPLEETQQSDRKVASPLQFYNPLKETERSEANLPHWNQGEAACFATFRLADSLPQEKLVQLERERNAWLNVHPEPWDEETHQSYYKLFSEKIEQWLDANYGSCVLREHENREIVENALKYFDGERYTLYAFVVMPNHVHVLFSPLGENTIPDILRSWKGFTAREINKRTGCTGTLWQKESWDTLIRSEKHFSRVEKYIFGNNPSRAQRRSDAPVASFENQRRSDIPVASFKNPLEETQQSDRKVASPLGFDVIIGNPPYVQLQSMGEMSVAYSKCGYESYNKNADIYCLFTERGYNLLKENGLISFIMPNKWMLVDYGKELRKFMAKTSLKQILNFGDIQFFKDAATIVCIFVTQKNLPGTDDVLALSLNQKTYHGDFFNEVKNGLSAFPREDFSEKEWIIQNPEHKKILAQMARGNAKLKDLPIEINYGIKTGFNDAFFIDEATKNRLIAEDPKSAEIIHSLARGRDITAWNLKNTDVYLINPHNGLKGKNLPPIDIENYPSIKKHLDVFWEKLAKRGDKGITPYNLRDCGYLEEFSKPKIIYPNMTSVFPFAYDEEKYFGNDKTFILTAKDEAFPLKALLAIFNSELAKLWIWYNCPELLGGTREIRKAYFENFPVPAISPEAQAPLVALADKMLSLNADLQRVVRNFHATLRDNLGVKKITGTLEAFYDLEFPAFLKELAKQKVKIPLAEQSEWRDFLSAERSRANALRDAIAATDGEINARVRALYGV